MTQIKERIENRKLKLIKKNWHLVIVDHNNYVRTCIAHYTCIYYVVFSTRTGELKM